MSDRLDGCALDFKAASLGDEEIAALLAELDEQGDRALAATAVTGRDLELAARLRHDHLPVIEVAGWRTRGDATLRPRGAVTHHTAGPKDAPGRRTPSLGICINGRPDLRGPLCNTYLGFDRKVYVIASGKANHAGLPDAGRVPWASGNSSAWGLEVEHPGTFALPPDMAELAARIQAATIRGTAGAERVVYHKEWTSRKIDLATAPSPAAHREAVARFLRGAPDPRAALRTWARSHGVLDLVNALIKAFPSFTDSQIKQAVKRVRELERS